MKGGSLIDWSKVPKRVPDACNQEVFNHGKTIAMLTGPRPWFIQRWVEEVARLSGQQVDWHFAGGRAMILFLGGYQAVRSAVESTIGELEKFAEQQMDNGYPLQYQLFKDGEDPRVTSYFGEL